VRQLIKDVEALAVSIREQRRVRAHHKAVVMAVWEQHMKTRP
jgi:hypothetical protein